MLTLAYRRTGHGEPLVLLHGLGSSRRAWDPVVPALSDKFGVIAVDLPGFGESPMLEAEATPAALAAAVGELLDELGIVAPHVAGNSLGGWVALELAAQRPVASVGLLSPAGLWRGSVPLYNRVSLLLSRFIARYLARPVRLMMRFRLGRLVVLGQTHGRPMRLTPEYARTAVSSFGTSPGFAAAWRATVPQGYLPDQPVDAPVTLAIGSRDWLLRKHSRHLDQLPRGTRVGNLPRCGHVPMADDPQAVVAFLVAATEVPSARCRSGARPS
jgi:pimeloyl-ACP methyl ester carboxylesterase